MVVVKILAIVSVGGAHPKCTLILRAELAMWHELCDT